MDMKCYHMSSFDGFPLYVREWSEVSSPQGLILIVHDVAEHSGRYQELCSTLSLDGYLVVAFDLRAFGASSRPEALGEGYKDIYQLSSKDVVYLYRHFTKKYGMPAYLMGTGYGGYLIMAALETKAITPKGVLLTGVGKLPSWRLRIIKLLSQCGMAKHRPKMVHNALLKAISPKSGGSILTRDQDKADGYKQDPLCGVLPTLGFDRSLLDGLLKTLSKRHMHKLAKVPYALFAGTSDRTLGKDGKHSLDLLVALRRLGLSVRFFGYEDARHSLVQETMRNRYIGHITEWLHTTDNPLPF